MEHIICRHKPSEIECMQLIKRNYVLDWNDHIGSRRATSSRAVTEATNPRRRSEKTLLERKTYQFWGDVWQKYTAAVGIMD